MTTIQAQMIGDRALLSRFDLERLVEIARNSEEIDLRLREDDLPTFAMMRLADAGSSFEFWNDPGEDIYTIGDGEPVMKVTLARGDIALAAVFGEELIEE